MPSRPCRSHRTSAAAALVAAGLLAMTPARAVDYCYLYPGQGYSCAPADVWPDLTIAGESYDLDKGIYRANSLLVGGAPPGVVLQSGGVNTVRSWMRLGWGVGDIGSYHLHGGLLSTAASVVGHRGSATMVQLAGTHIASAALDIGINGR